MKSVKVPVAVIVLLVIVMVILVVYMFNQNIKLAEEVVTNDKMKLENERLSLLANFNASQELENFEMREPIGFKFA